MYIDTCIYVLLKQPAYQEPGRGCKDNLSRFHEDDWEAYSKFQAEVGESVQSLGQLRLPGSALGFPGGSYEEPFFGAV